MTSAEFSLRRSKAAVPAQVTFLIVVTAVYFFDAPLQVCGDTRPAILVARSLLHDRDLYLDEEFPDQTKPPYFARLVGTHLVSMYPMGPAIFALPFVSLVDGLPPPPQNLKRGCSSRRSSLPLSMPG